MATFEFEFLDAKKTVVNTIRFDSSPSGSLTRAFGFAEGSVRLDEVDRKNGYIFYDVYAIRGGSDKESLVGRMRAVTREKYYDLLKSR